MIEAKAKYHNNQQLFSSKSNEFTTTTTTKKKKRKTKTHKKLKGLLCELLSSKHSSEKEKQLIQKNIGAILL